MSSRDDAGRGPPRDAGPRADGRPDRAAFLARYRRLLKSVREAHADTARHLDLARFLIENRYYERAHSPLKAARALQPRRLETLELLGGLYTRQSHHHEASLTYREILKYHPGEARAHYHLGTSLLALDRKEGAFEALAKAVEIDPSLEEAYWHLGRLAAERGSHEQALSYYQALKSLEPEAPELYHRIGLVQEARGLTDRAVAAYQHSLELADTHLEARLALARLYLDGGLPGKAREVLECVMTWDRRPAEAFVLLSRAYRDAGDEDRSRATLLQMATQYPRDARSRRELGRAYGEGGDKELAEEEYLRAIELDADDLGIMLELGDLYQTWGRPGKAIDLYRRGLKRFPEEARLYALLAEVYERHDRVEDGLKAISRAIEVEATNEAHHIRRARLLIELGRYDEALADFERARTINPASAEARLDAELIHGHQRLQEAHDLHRIGTEALAQRNYGQALVHFREVLKRAPDNVDWLKEYLDLALKTGRFNEALSTFEHLEALEPRDFSIIRRHADLAYRLHNFDQAVELYQRALTLDAESIAARIGLIRCLRHKLLLQTLAPDRVDTLEEQYRGSVVAPASENVALLEQAYLQITVGHLLRHGTVWADRAVESMSRVGPLETEEVSLYKWLGLYETYRKLGNEPQALKVLENLRRRFPDDPVFAVATVEHLAAVGQCDEAVRLAEEMEPKFPENGLLHARSLRALGLWARTDARAGRLARETVDRLRQHVAGHPEDAMGLFRLAMALYYLTRSSDWSETRKKILIALNKARTHAPRSLWPWWGLVKTGLPPGPGSRLPGAELARQVSQIQNAIALFPQEACFQYYLGRVMHLSADPGERDEGTRRLVTATLFDPCFMPAEFALGLKYQESRDETKAYHHFLRVLESVSGSGFQGQVQERLRRLVP